jgi:hypothetical protein
MRGGDPVTPDVTPNFKPEKPARQESTNQRRGRLNKQKGHRKQSLARKALEDLFGAEAAFHGRKAEESHWTHLPIRVEVKAGAQVKPVETRFLAAEKQSDAARATGDPRPFVFIAMPDGMTDGLFVCRLSTLKELLG